MNTPTATPLPPDEAPPVCTVRDAPAFDFYPERWLVGVAAMSDAEQISYLRLLCHQWLLGEAGLPPEVVALKRLAGKGVTPAVLAKLPAGTDGQRRNARLEVIRSEQRVRIAKSREKITKMNAAKVAGKCPAKAVRVAPAGVAGADGALQEGLVEGVQEPGGEGVQEGLEGALDRPLNGLLTTHRSPPTQVPEPVPAAGASGRVRTRPALGEARSAARQIGITPDDAEAWWLAREASEWTRCSNGAVMPVGDNWHADAKTYVNNTLERRRLGGQRTPRSDTANAPGRYA